METTGIRRPALKALITALAFLTASCATGSPRAGRSPDVSSSPTNSPRPTSVPGSTTTPSPASQEQTGDDDVQAMAALVTAAEDFLSSEKGVRWIGRRRTIGGGHVPGIGGVTLFLVTRKEGIAISLRIAGGEPTTACCLTPLRRGARPLAYIRTHRGGGILLAHVSPLVETVRYDCVQCGDAEGLIPRIASGRIRGVPQFALVFIRANADGGNDGYLVSFGSLGDRVDRDWIGLPPACTGPPCLSGLSWGLLKIGAERPFDP